MNHKQVIEAALREYRLSIADSSDRYPKHVSDELFGEIDAALAWVDTWQEAEPNSVVWGVFDDSEYTGVWLEELFVTEADANAHVQRKEEEARFDLYRYNPEREDYGRPYTSLNVYPRILHSALPDEEKAP